MITDTGFFPDGRWHGMAKALRTEGEGEQLLANLNRDLFAMALRQVSPGLPDEAVDEYWKAFGDEDRRRSQLDLYRSGDFSKLEPYDGKLAALGRPGGDRLGRQGRVRPGGRRPPLPQAAPGRAASSVLDDAGPLRDGGRPRPGRQPRSASFLERSSGYPPNRRHLVPKGVSCIPGRSPAPRPEGNSGARPNRGEVKFRFTCP